MLALALRRRTDYRLFYLAHHFAIFFLVVAVVHAWTHWYYACGGLVLWFYDRLVRIVRRSGPARLLSAAHDRELGVTRLEFAEDSVPAGGRRAGQYCWLALDGEACEWHPFTVSSSPASGTVTFHISEAGEGAFTNRLARAVLGRGENGVRFALDGPYGRAPDPSSRECLVLVAGGIGITPMHSVLEELLLGGVPDGAPLRRVILLWSARSGKMFGMYAETLARKSEQFSLDLRLHLTRDEAPEARWACFARDGESPTEAERRIYRYNEKDEPEVE